MYERKEAFLPVVKISHGDAMCSIGSIVRNILITTVLTSGS